MQFIIRSILLLLFRSLFFICNYFRVKETYTNNSKLVPCYQLNKKVDVGEGTRLKQLHGLSV